MHAHRIRTDVLIESDIYAKATVQLKKSSKDLNHMMQILADLPRGVAGRTEARRARCVVGALLVESYEQEQEKRAFDLKR